MVAAPGKVVPGTPQAREVTDGQALKLSGTPPAGGGKAPDPERGVLPGERPGGRRDRPGGRCRGRGDGRGGVPGPGPLRRPPGPGGGGRQRRQARPPGRPRQTGPGRLPGAGRPRARGGGGPGGGLRPAPGRRPPRPGEPRQAVRARLALDAVLHDVAALQRAGQPRHPVPGPLRVTNARPWAENDPTQGGPAGARSLQPAPRDEAGGAWRYSPWPGPGTASKRSPGPAWAGPSSWWSPTASRTSTP